MSQKITSSKQANISQSTIQSRFNQFKNDYLKQKSPSKVEEPSNQVESGTGTQTLRINKPLICDQYFMKPILKSKNVQRSSQPHQKNKRENVNNQQLKQQILQQILLNPENQYAMHQNTQVNLLSETSFAYSESSQNSQQQQNTRNIKVSDSFLLNTPTLAYDEKYNNDFILQSNYTNKFETSPDTLVTKIKVSNTELNNSPQSFLESPVPNSLNIQPACFSKSPLVTFSKSKLNSIGSHHQRNLSASSVNSNSSFSKERRSRKERIAQKKFAEQLNVSAINTSQTGISPFDVSQGVIQQNFSLGYMLGLIPEDKQILNLKHNTMNNHSFEMSQSPCFNKQPEQLSNIINLDATGKTQVTNLEDYQQQSDLEEFAQEITTPQYRRDTSLDKLLVKSQNKEVIMNFAQNAAAIKIQRVFRTYRIWRRIQQMTMQKMESRKQVKLQKILAAKVIVKHVKKWILKKRGKEYRKYMIYNLIRLQRWMRQKLLCNKTKISKALLLAYVKGWRVRKSLCLLELMIKAFVMEDNLDKKHTIRVQFNTMFDRALRDRLYIKPLTQAQNILLNRQNKILKTEEEITNHSNFKEKITITDHKILTPNFLIKKLKKQSIDFNRQSQTSVKPRINSKTNSELKNQISKNQDSHNLNKDLQSLMNETQVKHNFKNQKNNESQEINLMQRDSTPKQFEIHHKLRSRDHQINHLNSAQETQDSSKNTNTKSPGRTTTKLVNVRNSDQQNQEKDMKSHLDSQKEQLLKIQVQYKKQLAEYESMMDFMIDNEIEQIESLQNQTSYRNIMIGQRAKLLIKSNRLLQDMKETQDKVFNYNYKKIL
eukprot:403337566